MGGVVAVVDVAEGGGSGAQVSLLGVHGLGGLDGVVGDGVGGGKGSLTNVLLPGEGDGCAMWVHGFVIIADGEGDPLLLLISLSEL